MRSVRLEQIELSRVNGKLQVVAFCFMCSQALNFDPKPMTFALRGDSVDQCSAVSTVYLHTQHFGFFSWEVNCVV